MIRRSIKGLWRFLKTPLGRRFLGLLLLLSLLDDLHYRFVPSKEYKPVCHLKDKRRAEDPSHLDIEAPYSEAFLNAFSEVLDDEGILHVRYRNKLYTTRDHYRGNPGRDHYEGPRDDSPKWKSIYTTQAALKTIDPLLPQLYRIGRPIEAVADFSYCQGVMRVTPADGDIAALLENERQAHLKRRRSISSWEFDQRMLKSNPNWCDASGRCMTEGRPASPPLTLPP